MAGLCVAGLVLSALVAVAAPEPAAPGCGGKDCPQMAPAPNVGPGAGERMGMRMGMAANPGRGILNHAEELKLTDAQVAALKKLYDGAEEKMIDRRARLEKAELKLRSLLEQKEIDLKAVRGQLEAAAQERVEMQMSQIENMAAVKKILTEEQLAQMEQMRTERMQRFQDRGARWGGAGRADGEGPDGQRPRRMPDAGQTQR